jgi:adenine phosphoribosyltransferase
MHEDAASKARRVLIVDDLLATGGTAAATVNLVRDLGATVVGVQVLIEILDLGGRAKLGDTAVQTVITY